MVIPTGTKQCCKECKESLSRFTLVTIVTVVLTVPGFVQLLKFLHYGPLPLNYITMGCFRG